MTADNGQKFKYGYDSTSQKYGYYVAGSGGADTFIPFKSTEYIEFSPYTGSGGVANIYLPVDMYSAAVYVDNEYGSGNVRLRNINTSTYTTMTKGTQYTFDTGVSYMLEVAAGLQAKIRLYLP